VVCVVVVVGVFCEQEKKKQRFSADDLQQQTRQNVAF
jgi:uncharacterized membrane protein YcaP (DUF421 family)